MTLIDSHRVYNKWTRAMFTLIFLFLMVACSTATPPDLTSESRTSSAIQQSSRGLVAFEAEGFHASIKRGKHAWTRTDDATASGRVALQARPVRVVNRDHDFVDRSPRLDFKVNFKKTGTHYIWVYGKAVAGDVGTTDSVHIGLNGKAVGSAKRISGFSSTWSWHKGTMDGSRARLKVTSKGVHTVNVWMREDGFTLDRVVLTTDKTFDPNTLKETPHSFTSTLIAKHSDKCLGVANDTKKKGMSLRQLRCNDASSQRFVFTPVPGVSDTYTVQNANSGLCIDVARKSAKDGANVLQWTCLGGKNQQFRVKAEPGSSPPTFRLIARHSGKVLDVARASQRTKANVIQYTSHGGDNQRWQLPGFEAPSEAPVSEPPKARPSSPKLPSVKAKRADAFVDSIGVNTHLHYTDTVYDDFSRVLKPRLLESGIRHVRDSVYTYPGIGKDSFYYRRIRDLAAKGVRFNLFVPQASRYGPDADLSLLDDIYRWTDRSIEMFEGPNEPDITGVKNWQSATPAFQERLYKTVNGDASLKHIPVVGPAIVRNPEGAGDLSSWLDYGNWHPYPGGICPTCKSVYGSSFDTRLPKHREMSGDKPMVVTETGYHNAVNASATEDHKPASERAAGKYLPRLLLEYFNRGVARTYLYEFLDVFPDPGKREREHNFGLIRNDGSPKPAFYAVKSTIKLLADPGPAFKPHTLHYKLSGETASVHSTLLQKRDGRFFLALWSERSSWDNGQRANRSDRVSARRDLNVAPQSVTLTLGTPMSKVVKHRLRDNGTMSKTSLSAKRSLKLDVGDTVTFIELIP